MDEIKINTKGIILNGEFEKWSIFIEDLDHSEGDYLILFTSPDNKQGYDDWVENYSSLEGYLKEAKWKIQWLSGT